MQKQTEQLLQEIANTSDIQAFLDENEPELLQSTAHEYLNAVLAARGLSVSEVARASGQGEYVYKVFAGTRRASRDILIAIAFALSMRARDTDMLLRLSGTARLDPRNRRDAVTLHALLKNLDLPYLNNLLYDMGEDTY